MGACQSFSEDISASLDGELSPSRLEELNEHVSSCAACQSAKNLYQKTINLLSNIKFQTIPEIPDLWTSLKDKIPSICEVIENDFSAYLDGELIAPAKEGVSNHLENCPACYQKFQELSKVNILISRSFELPKNIEIDIWSAIKDRLDTDCLLIKEELSSFYDREVSSSRHRTITSHLMSCSACRTELSSISSTSELIRTNYLADIPENFDLVPTLRDKIQVIPFISKDKRRTNTKSKRFYTVAAVLAAGFIAGICFFVNTYSIVDKVAPITAESYLIEAALGEPSERAEAMVYENQ